MARPEVGGPSSAGPLPGGNAVIFRPCGVSSSVTGATIPLEPASAPEASGAIGAGDVTSQPTALPGSRLPPARGGGQPDRRVWRSDQPPGVAASKPFTNQLTG